MIEKRTYNYITYSELEKLIEENFHVDEFSIPCDMELSNNTYFVTGGAKADLDKWDQNDLTNFLRGNPRSYNNTELLVQCMINRDIIPEGKYLVHVSW